MRLRVATSRPWDDVGRNGRSSVVNEPDLRHLVPGTLDHYVMGCLRVRGLVPRIAAPYRLKPWQVIRCALHRLDAACLYLVTHYYRSQPSRRVTPPVTSRAS